MNDLDSQLSQLPRELPPPRDLWPGIATSIAAEAAQRRSGRRLPLAMAAGIAIAATAGLLGWRLSLRWPVEPGSATGAGRFAEPAGSQYVSMRTALEHTYRERLELLAPATRRRIEQDLATIRAANADIRRALAADPQSAVLNRLLESTWQQEFDLYSTVVRNTEPAAQRSRT
jgi:hypothetical protein